MKLGVIGAGKWGQNIISTLRDLDMLGAIAESSQPAIEACKQKFGADIPVVASIEGFQDMALDGVCVVTPADTHARIATRSLQMGFHTFVEKPLALNSSDAKKLVELANSRRRILMVGHLLLYQPAIQWMRKYLSAGKLGTLYSIHQSRLNLGTVRRVENVLWSLGVHDVAAIQFLLGQSPSRIQLLGQAALRTNIEDDIYLHMIYPSGVQAHLHTSWLWPEKQRTMTIIGSKGILIFDEIKGEVTLQKKYIHELDAIDEGSEVVYRDNTPPLGIELQHFADCIASHSNPLSDGTSGAEVVKILESATDTSQTSQFGAEPWKHTPRARDPLSKSLPQKERENTSPISPPT